MNFRIIIAEDEEITLKHLMHALKREGYEAVGVKNGLEALEHMERGLFDVLITDVRMPGMSGIELLERVKERFHGIEVLIITGFGSIDAAVEAMKKGAYEYIAKPFNLDELILKVRNIHERKTLMKENAALKAGVRKEVSFIARSAAMQKIVSIVEGIKDSDRNVFLTGESGVGKSLLAKIIHFTSGRQDMPFLSLNCATFGGEALSAELFGAEFSAAKAKQGLLEIADGGTLFLDGITEMPADAQARLLGVIETGELARNGSVKSVRVNVRLIAAASQNMKDLISEGKFMEDLYYRLNLVDIFVPPLREHKEDIGPLSAFFLQKHLVNTNKKISGLTKEAIGILEGYSFPGNVRELENIIERAVILEKGPLITPESLPRSIKMFRIETFPPDRILTLDELTRDYAEKVLLLAAGDRVKAAGLLGIDELSLARILKKE